MVRMTSGILEFKPLGEPLGELLPVIEVMLVVSSIAVEVVSSIAVEVVSVPIRKIQCNISSIIILGMHLRLSKGNA